MKPSFILTSIRFGFNSTDQLYETQSLVWGIARAIMNLKMNKDQKKARNTLRDQREALRPL